MDGCPRLEAAQAGDGGTIWMKDGAPPGVVSVPHEDARWFLVGVVSRVAAREGMPLGEVLMEMREWEGNSDD